MKTKSILLFFAVIVTAVSCSDDNDFTVAPTQQLHFSADTLNMDTVFANVPTSTRTFWVYNRSGRGVRINNVRLLGGNQNGFRVNVDGTFLGASTGFQTSDVELHRQDSLRVFVELTSPVNAATDPQLLEDVLEFELENGRRQQVVLRASTWNAVQLRSLRVKNDTVISSTQPIIIYEGIRVDSAVTLTVAAGTTLYFHANAGVEVYGRLLLKGTPTNNVVLRGDRLDRMFPYLPYDRVSGQWNGIRLKTSSYNNEFEYADIHSTFDGIVADSSDVSQTKLTMNACTVHNCQGDGVAINNSSVVMQNCEITNTQGDCLRMNGGEAQLMHCTLAQFYPFSASRGAALRISAENFPLTAFLCRNSLITGYANDVLYGNKGEKSLPFNFDFSHCIIRTPRVTTDDSVHFSNVVFEDPSNTVSMGKKHFLLIDEDKQIYDFRLADQSIAIDAADAANTLPTDRRGNTRDAKPDIGANEFLK